MIKIFNKLNNKLLKIRNANLQKIYFWMYLSIILVVFITMIFLGKNMFASFFKWTSYLRGDLIYSIGYLVNGYASSDAHPYPPLVNLYYTLILNATNILEPGMDKLFFNRLFALFINWMPVIISVIIIYNFFKNNNYKISLFCVMLIAMPAPLFTSFRSGNYTYLMIPFILYYIFNYDNDDKIKKEISLISLAIASNLKIIPALYSLLLINNKDIKSFIRYILYSVIIFFLPIFFILPNLTYIDRLILMLKSMFSYSGIYRYNQIGCFKIIYHLLNILCSSLGFNIDCSMATKVLSKIVFLILLVYFFVINEKYEKLYCLTLMEFLIGVITYHSFALFIIPMIYFISKSKINNDDFALFILMSIMLTLTFFIFFIPPYMFIKDLYFRVALHSAYIDLLLTIQIFIFLMSRYSEILSFIKNKRL